MEFLQGVIIRKEQPLTKKYVRIWGLLLDKQFTYKQISETLKTSSATISKAIKMFKRDYPRLVHLLNKAIDKK